MLISIEFFAPSIGQHAILRADVDPVPNRKSSKSGVERMLEFGRELFQMGQRLEKENGANDTNRRMLEVRVTHAVAPASAHFPSFRSNVSLIFPLCRLFYRFFLGCI